MKELSTEEKAKRYDEAIERAKKLQETCDSTAGVGWCEYIFPELKESEDERIRKELIDYHRSMAAQADDYVHEAWIVWLEKQGGRKHDAWSEEDEVMIKVFDSIIRYIVEVVDKDVLERFGTNREELFSWLKSLRPQNTWKPSKEQMKAIEHICDGNYNVDLDILDSIYRDFKKLREE